ncbi:hypothetical protein B0F90DRAFT_1920266 [Multifurca ochricompacta]|uniref:Uncharacterized protein n=1 Tax=Multifurca ochricompacta TaxID=376703 RepID=A0AAD4LYD6_9AGAM|nr:hypothetical protein B0F90DRAFT_1920266 [Multifurca ochricompacta]
MALSNDMAALIGFACEAVAYGAYCVLFILTMLLLSKMKRAKRDINTPITIASIFLFLVCTAHFAIEFNHYYTTLQAIGVNHFADETNPLLGADLLISLADLIGDAILIYRCWLIWGKNYFVIIIPSLCAVAGFACLAESLHLLLGINPTAPVAPNSLVPLATAGYSLPLATNVLVTLLIISRIWYLSPVSNPNLRGIPPPSRTARHVIDIVVESGALYLVTQAIFVGLFAAKHPAQAIIAVIAVQIYGIVPTLIILRVARGIPQVTTLKTGGILTLNMPSSRIRVDTTAFTDTTIPVGDIDMHDFKSDEDSLNPKISKMV